MQPQQTQPPPQSHRQYRIRADDLTPVDRNDHLGSGGFGTVRRMFWRLGPYQVAVKSLSISRENQSAQIRAEFQREARLHASLRHDHILIPYGIVVDERNNNELRIVMPLMPRSLYGAIHCNTRPPFNWRTRARICAEIAAGLHHLHTQEPQVLHRDLKSPNVLLDQHDCAKLVDFGLAKVRSPEAVDWFVSPDLTARAAVGTPHWQAPELHRLVPIYSAASDIYALGIVAWELAALRRPFYEEYGDDRLAIVRAVARGERPAIPEHDVPTSFAETLQRCWQQDFSRRPTAEVAHHLFARLM